MNPPSLSTKKRECSLLKQSIDLGIEHMRYHMILGETCYKKGNYAEAQKILNSLKSLGKHFSDKHIILAKIHLKNDDCTKALLEYEEMTNECPQRFKSILNGLLDIINQYPFVERSYELLHNLYKKRGKEVSLISELKSKVEENEHNRQCLLGTLEHLYYLLGQNTQAIPLLIQHQKRYPNDPKPFYLLGNIYLESGKYSEAIIQYSQVIKLDPSRKTNIISSMEKMHDYKDADNDVINYIVNLYIEEDRLAQAEKILDHLLETKPDIVNYQDQMEQVLLKVIKNSLLSDLLEFCISKIEKLIRLRPDNIRSKPGSRRTPKSIERNIIKAYHRFGSNRYELVLIFKPYYLDKTPSPATMDRIKARYPLNKSAKKIINRYEKQAPGELAHIDLSKLPKDIRCSFKIKELYIAAICDDCTRLTYAEIIKDKKASTLTYFMIRSLSWFKQIYNFEFESIISDNGREFKGTLMREHPFKTTCKELGAKLFTLSLIDHKLMAR